MSSAVSRRLPLGRSDLRLPDRGLAARRRRRAEQLASLLAHAGHVDGGDTGDVACDHYRRFAEDVALMRSSGSTPIASASPGAASFPQGRGTREPSGPRLLLAARRSRSSRTGSSRCVTLYHWDLPAALDDRGGWLNRDIAGVVRATTRASCSGRSATACRCGRRSTSRGSWPTPATSTECTRRGTQRSSRRRSPRTTCCARTAPAVEAFRARRRRRADRPRRQPRAEVSGVETRRRIVAATERADAYMNRQYLDPALPRPLPGGASRDLRRGVAAVSRRGLRAIRRADRLPRHQLLHARGHAARRRRLPVAREPRPPAASALHRDGLGGASREPHARARRGCASGTARSRSTSPRTAPRSRIRRRPEAAVVDDPLRVEYLRAHLRAAHAAIAARSRSARLLRLVATRQLRVGRRASRSASASCTSTSRRSGARPRRAREFYRDVIRTRG